MFPCYLSSPSLHGWQAFASSAQDSKTKTWPPKAPWQHSTHTNTMPNPSSSLFQMNIPPSSQWGDTMQMLQSPVWSTASDCSPSAGISSGFPFTQQQKQQQQQQHKPMTKDFKSFPLKPEHRSSYLPQYWWQTDMVTGKCHWGSGALLAEPQNAELYTLQSTPTELEEFKASAAKLSTNTGSNTFLSIFFHVRHPCLKKRCILDCHVLTMRGAWVTPAAP